jgi:hypothetical protein
MVGSQIGNLTFGPSFGHKLCFKYSNGSCKPILDIYIPKYFQKHKKLFNPKGFDPCNRSLKIWESIGTPTPKVGTHLGVWRSIPSHFPTLPWTWNVIPGLHSWSTPFTSPCFDCEPKVRVAIISIFLHYVIGEKDGLTTHNRPNEHKMC